jgi:hypothetical protein
MMNSKYNLKSSLANYSIYEKLQDHLSDESVERYSGSGVSTWSAISLKAPRYGEPFDFNKTLLLRLDALDTYRAILLNEKNKNTRSWHELLKNKIYTANRWAEKHSDAGGKGILLFHISGIIFGFKERTRINEVRDGYRGWLKENRDLLRPLVGAQLFVDNPAIDAGEMAELTKMFDTKHGEIASNTEYSVIEPSLSYLIRIIKKNNQEKVSPELVKLIRSLGFGEVLWGRKRSNQRDNESMSTYIQKMKKYDLVELRSRYPIPR